MLVKNISLEQIFDIVDKLILNQISRESVADWAFDLQQAFDERNLNFIPAKDEKRIINAVLYLTGVDLKISPQTYLHGVEDFIEFKKNI